MTNSELISKARKLHESCELALLLFGLGLFLIEAGYVAAEMDREQ